MPDTILDQQVATMRAAVERAQQTDLLHDEEHPPMLSAFFFEATPPRDMEEALQALRDTDLMPRLRGALEWWIFKRENRMRFKGSGLDGITLTQLIAQLPRCYGKSVLIWAVNVEHFKGSIKLHTLLAHFTPLPQQQLEIERVPPWKRETSLAGKL